MSTVSGFDNIFDAAREGMVDDVRFFVERNRATVNAKDQHKNTPIIYAAAWNFNIDVLQYLISQGGKVNVKNCVGMTPLLFVVSNNSRDVDNNSARILQILVSNGANVNARNGEGEIALDIANTRDEILVLRAAGGAKQELIVMIVGCIIGAIIGISGGFTGFLIGTYLGIGIGLSMTEAYKELILTLQATWHVFWTSLKNGEGIGTALAMVFIGLPLNLVFWRIPRLGIIMLINPISAINKFYYRYCRAL